MALLDLATSTLALTAIIAVRYVLMAGLTHRLVWPSHPERRLGTALNQRPPKRVDVLREARLSLLSAGIYAFPAAIALEAWKHGQGKLYSDVHLYGLIWLPISALLYLLVQDSFYYWLHRLLHHRWLFRLAHAGHHRSREPTPWASFAFDPLEAVLTAWLLPALTFILPIHVGVALLVLTLMSVAAVINHCGRELLPPGMVHGPIGDWIIGATHHHGHHQRQQTNFGLYLRLWDRLMKTDAMPEVAPRPKPSSVG